MDEQAKCPKHRNGLHCWHDFGSTGYKGKYEMRTRVECCHCGLKATKVEFCPDEAIEYDPAITFSDSATKE